ncbi:MAG TPA: hypothetical protein VNI54_19010 [Thermoanaerobaculia bacterium]|nr:hypothetical protein [Thermoanaerobaculia bacterium]
MPKAQGKKAVAAAGGKGAAKKVAAKVKAAAKAVKKKIAPKKAAPAKPAPKKPAPKPAPRKPAPKPVKPPKPAPKAKAVAKPVAKPVAKAAKAAAKVVKKAVAKVAPKAAAKPAAKPALKPKAVKPAPPTPAPVAPNVPAVPKPAPAAREPEKAKRGRRARPRVVSSGAPAASWLSTEKPRPASFIAAPARAEAPSAIAAPPASSDRLIREEDLAHPAVRTVPVRIDVEQGAGRFYVIANPMEVSVRVGEGIEWDFRYIGGADVNVDEIVIELEKPSPFSHSVFRTRKPGGARPHRQLSGGAVASAAGKRVQYTVRAMTPFKTELANTRVFLSVTA